MVSFIYDIQMGALEYAEIKYYSDNSIPELYNELWFNLISALKYALAQKYNWPSLYCSPQPNKNKST